MTLLRGRNVRISGTGVYIPERVMRNVDFTNFLDTSDEWISERTGIRERHFAADGEKCSDLAYMAAENALENSGMSNKDIDMVIVASNTPDSIFPPMACKVQSRLGSVNAGAFDVQAGCTGSLAAMQTAISGIASGIWDNVLVIGCERFKDILDWKDRKTCILFGDAAGACLLSVSEDGAGGFTAAKLFSDGTKADYIMAGPSDDSFQQLSMKGNDVFKYVNRNLPKFISDFCKESRVDVEQVNLWVLHQANARIIDDIVRRLKISADRVPTNLERYGNTSAASLLVTLDEAVKNNKIKSGDKVCFAAFGAGMTFGALMYEA